METSIAPPTRSHMDWRASGSRPASAFMWLERNRVEYLLAYFATAEAGLVFSPLNYWLRGPEMQQLIDLVQPACPMACGR